MNTDDTIRIQGLNLKPADIEMIKSLIKSNPSWHRTRLSKEICELWFWKRHDNSLKDMACRTMLLKLERQNYLKLPESRQTNLPANGKRKLKKVLHGQFPVEVPIQDIYPITVKEVSRSGYNENLFDYLLFKYHYLSYKTTVGESMKYLVIDKDERPLSCVLFGSAAWKTGGRDKAVRLQ